MRLSLCVRKYLLPCVASVATASVILADDDVSTQAILFNVLSVSFLLGADDKLYDIVIPSAIEKVVDAFVEETV